MNDNVSSPLNPTPTPRNIRGVALIGIDPYNPGRFHRVPAIPAPRKLGVAHALWATAALALGTSAQLSASDGPPRHYQQTNLVSDVPGMAATTDANLVNSWGLARSATSPWWVADNGTGLSTIYNGSGAVQSLVVTIPNVPGSTDPAAPTGTVFNGVATDFLTAPGKPAHFLFATENGTIAGWNSGTSAVLVVNNGGNAVYKGLTIAKMNGAQFLYAANFMTRMVDVFDGSFHPVTLASGAFHDPQIPSDYGPFNVQSLGDSVVVAFAQTQPGSVDEAHGPGKGFVDVFSSDGTLQRRLRWGSWFNAPWGIAMAPSNFGRFSNMILVGQFGSGKIAAFDPNNGEFRGMVRTSKGQTLLIDGLWALSFGNGANAGPTNTLFFTAGIDDEAHGLFGTITPAAGQNEQDNNQQDAQQQDNGDNSGNGSGGGGDHD